MLFKLVESDGEICSLYNSTESYSVRLDCGIVLFSYFSYLSLIVPALSFPQKQLAQFDTETQDKMAQAELDTVPSLEVKHAHARLELRERQLQELAGTMSELSTEEVCSFS